MQRLDLIIGFVLGALAAAAGVFFWLKGSWQVKAHELAERARAGALEEGRKLAQEAESQRVAADATKADAARLAAQAQAARDQARAETEAARQKAELEIGAERQKLALESKEIALRARVEAESALEKKRAEVSRLEERLEQKEEQLDRKLALHDQRDQDLLRREKQARETEQRLGGEEERYRTLVAEATARLERAAGLTSEEAKKQVIEGILEEARHEAAKTVARLEEEANEEAKERTGRIVGIAIQRYAGDYSVEHTVSTVHLQSDEMKGRIIGREGRNIRALEAATGIDILIDDTPESITLSGFHPVRREVARRAIEELMKDGRIHPARIEEVVEKQQREVEASLKQWGEKAIFELGLTGFHPEIVKLLGTLRYRTSHTQNQWQHAIEVGFLVGEMAGEMGLNVKQARRAGLLHDLGKAVSHEVEGGHAVIGADLAKKYGEKEPVVHAIRAHHDDVKPETLLAHLVAAGDAISGARPGARSGTVESYVKRLEDLERISLSFPGVERAFAVQAGREMRVIVDNGRVSDEMAVLLSRDIARRIEKEVSYPGQIKVMVIRETRAVEIAR